MLLFILLTMAAGFLISLVMLPLVIIIGIWRITSNRKPCHQQCKTDPLVGQFKWPLTGDSDAQYALGPAHYLGDGVAQNFQEAFQRLTLAAAQGKFLAQFILGIMHQNGQGFVQNYSRSYMWFSVAAAQGFAQAVESRDRMRMQLSPQALAQAQATLCFESNYQDCY